jgi:cell shape-determining protein MreC
MTSPNPFDSYQKRRRRANWFGPVSLFVAALLLCTAVVFWQTKLSSLVWKLLTPAVQFRNTLSGSEVSNLQAQLASTTAALADRDALYSQNIELKKILGRPQTSTQVLAAVLLRPPGLPYDTLMIDTGADSNVVVGDLVFAAGTVAIGEVLDVYAHTSRVSLFSAPGRTYEAEVTPKATQGSVLPVSLQGQGAGSFAGQVPAGSVAAVGDTILIPSLNNEVLGSIARIDAPSGSSFETLYVQLPINIFSLQYVQVQTHI